MKTETQNILIVDDERQNIHLLANILKSEYTIIAAINGEDALKRTATAPLPDLILLDIRMPGMDGYEVCRRLKTHAATRHIPIIFITVMNEVEDEARGLELGAIDYITKPISPSIVKARVKNHLELKRAHQEIADQKRQLEQQNQELLEAAQLREDVERIARHDLKNPLGLIVTYPDLIVESEQLSEKGMKMLQRIQEAGYRMLDMINRSLDLFKMEQGIYQLKPASVELLHVIRKIEIEMHRLLQTKNLSFVVLVGERPAQEQDTFFVNGEELLCYAMLANLVKNALEASPEGEQITMTLAYDQHTSVIRIHNQGVVPEAIRPRFFEKYVTSGKKHGTGLGTYSAKLVAETQQGRIAMTSADAEGTTITITLPQGTHSRQRPEAPVLQAHVAPMIPPPGEEFTMLIQAASIGNITAIRESLTRIEALGQPFTPFVTTLHQLTDAFQLADIREFLASCQNVSA